MQEARRCLHSKALSNKSKQTWPRLPAPRSQPPPPEQSRSSEWTQFVVVRDSAASRRGEFGSHWSCAETYVNAPVYDGWITEKAEAGERGEFGDKGRVMASLPHLRVKTEKLIWKKTMFIFLTILRKEKTKKWMENRFGSFLYLEFETWAGRYWLCFTVRCGTVWTVIVLLALRLRPGKAQFVCLHVDVFTWLICVHTQHGSSISQALFPRLPANSTRERASALQSSRL